MRIVIDMQGAQTASRFRGIGRYTLSFVKAVLRNRGDHDIILALSGQFAESIEPIRAYFEGLLPQENIRVWYGVGSVKECEPGNEFRRDVSELMREAFLASLQPDLIHICSLFEGFLDDAVVSIGKFETNIPISVCLYDLIPLLNPEQYLTPNPNYERYYYRKINFLKKASCILAISQSAKQEGENIFETEKIKIFSISSAVEDCFRPIKIDINEKSNFLSKFGINRSFILYTGATDERKNLPRLIAAYASLPIDLRDQYQLVFAGGMPIEHTNNFRQEAKKQNLNRDEFIVTGWVSDEELILLYNLCKVYVFPSWHEGFGLPALEAMACGAVVIGSNTSSIPEVIGLEDALFNPYSVDDIADKIVHVLKDQGFYQKLKTHNIQQVKKFSWNETGRRSIIAWEDIHSTIKLTKTESNLSVHNKLIKEIALLLKESSQKDIITISHYLSKNERNFDHERQLLVDISELIQRDSRTGIQRVVRSILKHWLISPPDGYKIQPVYATDGQVYQYARKFTRNFLGEDFKEQEDEPVEYSAGDIFFALDFQPNIQSTQLEFYAEMRRYGVTVKFMLYDLLCIQQPQNFPIGALENFTKWLEVVAENNGVVCISKAVADNFREWFDKNKNQKSPRFSIDWFHLGADVRGSHPSIGLPKESTEIINKIKTSTTFLMVGTLEPRKGHSQILDVFELLWEKDVNLNLLFVGKKGWLIDELLERIHRHPELNKRLIWIEGTSDEYLELIYSSCDCLIAASYGEGFGLPLIEAAQHGLPIIARDIPVFREVANDNAYYFDSNDPNEIADRIRNWLSLYNISNHPSTQNMRWLTWKESASILLSKLMKI